MSDYYQSLLERYNWYIEETDKMHRQYHYKGLPSTTFYYQMQRGCLKPQTHDLNWLEYAIDKLQENLAGIEEVVGDKNRKNIDNNQKYI